MTEGKINPETSPRCVLLVEDDEAMALGLRFNLEEEGFSVQHCTEGESGLEVARLGGFDLIVLDMLLPGLNGFEVLGQLRQFDVRTPVLILSASAGSDAIVQGLQAGADDYLTKPFDLDVLLARIRSLIRSRLWLAGPSGAHELVLGAVRIDLRLGRVEHPEGLRELSHKETLLLKQLAQKRGQPVGRDQLLRDVWGYSDGIQTRTLDTFILNLRKKIEIDPKRPTWLVTVQGTGYQLRE